ncbi:MAG TPA: ABC transporter permease [Casimicrobiaceae bacterium]|nr:ABC transporter permease [Casimicrobiaceae bacterium]
MTLSALLIQLLNGLAGASSLFLVAAGLSLIFGVTRIVNFAHGSFMMLGAYLAYSLIGRLAAGGLGYWAAVLLAALGIGLLGALIEATLLRRLYRAPELLQLIATFGIVLIIRDAVLHIWGAEDLLGPRAPGLQGTVAILGRAVPQYDLFLIACGPLVWLLLLAVLRRTRWGLLVRAASQDRVMTAALGVDQARLFSGVFFVGALLAGLAGALQLPREPANLNIDLAVIADAFVVTVAGGLGSISGAFIAALIIGVVKALCIGIGEVEMFGMTVAFSKLTLVAEFMVMAIVLIVRPWGLLGRPPPPTPVAELRELQQPPSRRFALGVATGLLLLVATRFVADEYTLVLLTEILLFALFGLSLQLLMGTGGMASFGHAAFLGAGAYAAALASHLLPMGAALFVAPLVAGALALVCGWFCVRLSGVYLAMLTLAFAQIVWSIVWQWDAVTGGSNGLVGIWPAAWLASPKAYYLFALALAGAAMLLLWRLSFSGFGYALRAARDSALRAGACGIDVQRLRWAAFTLAGAFAGFAGSLYAYAKGSIAPELLAIPRSIDGLLIVLLGGLQALSGPLVGAAVFIGLQDTVARHTEYWRAFVGAAILAITLAFPAGIVGTLKHWLRGEGA